ncbi:MAG: hypothetical protein KAJ79_04670 [Candidatus Omnitrophica bacterium]|nr:hypothetical protein [Candidatus Omnitrophota bacterium]
MECPMRVNYSRMCEIKTGSRSMNTLVFCTTNRYTECPLYRIFNNIGFHCEYLDKCQACEYFRICDFDIFTKAAKKFCLSKKNRDKCARYKLRKQGIIPQLNMHPNGSIISK